MDIPSKRRKLLHPAAIAVSLCTTMQRVGYCDHDCQVRGAQQAGCLVTRLEYARAYLAREARDAWLRPSERRTLEAEGRLEFVSGAITLGEHPALIDTEAHVAYIWCDGCEGYYPETGRCACVKGREEARRAWQCRICGAPIADISRLTDGGWADPADLQQERVTCVDGCCYVLPEGSLRTIGLRAVARVGPAAARCLIATGLVAAWEQYCLHPYARENGGDDE